MALGLLLPATLLGYLAGGLGLALGAGWQASLGLLAGVGSATLLLFAAVLALRARAARGSSAGTPTGPATLRGAFGAGPRP
ncbi:hypothetical protein [Jannaschia formosa]|uniref:hypothetical protein n=1 Tax=Jannaschia formosa TaxID=2259592 RepID=UPI001074D861|nr:hypothetical protein [Jannaschia formosa]TFL17135.1 hypothetical protein DR046_16485 [Jannaschia formosa]